MGQHYKNRTFFLSYFGFWTIEKSKNSPKWAEAVKRTRYLSVFWVKEYPKHKKTMFSWVSFKF